MEFQTPDINTENLPENSKNLAGYVAAPLALFGVYKLGRAGLSKLRARRVAKNTPVVVPPIED